MLLLPAVVIVVMAVVVAVVVVVVATAVLVVVGRGQASGTAARTMPSWSTPNDVC